MVSRKVVGLLLLAGAATAGLAWAVMNAGTVRAGGVASAFAIAANGQYVSSVTYGPTDEMRIATIVNKLNPLTIQLFVNGRPEIDPRDNSQVVHEWDPSTGNNYVIDVGPAGGIRASQVFGTSGSWSVYTETTFADGSRSRSNTVTITLLGGPYPGSYPGVPWGGTSGGSSLTTAGTDTFISRPSPVRPGFLT